MKHLVIFEYLTAQLKNHQYQNEDNLIEGMKMVDKISLDFQKSNKVKKISIIRDNSIPFKKNKNINYLLTSRKKNWIDVLKKIDQNSTKVLIIAPESNNIFFKILRKILSLGLETLNSDVKEVKKFSSKILTFYSLEKNKIPCVKTFTKIEDIKNFNLEYIVKPVFSAGSENVFIAKNFLDLNTIIKKITFPYVIQYYKPKLSGSFTMICKDKKVNLISCNEHILTFYNKRLKQVGSKIGEFERYRNDFEIIAKLLVNNFSGLYGYIGVDVIFVNKVWKVVDINARFTSSYLGIKKKYGEKIKNLIIDFYCKNEINKAVSIKSKNKKINYFFKDD